VEDFQRARSRGDPNGRGRQGYVPCRQAVQRAYAKLAVADENSEEADDTEWALREKLVELCKHIEVKSEHVALADAIAILSVLQTGELPETDPTIPPTSETSETT